MGLLWVRLNTFYSNFSLTANILSNPVLTNHFLPAAKPSGHRMVRVVVVVVVVVGGGLL